MATLFSGSIGGVPITITVDVIILLLIGIILFRFFKKTLKIVTGIVFTALMLMRIFGVFQVFSASNPNMFLGIINNLPKFFS